MDDDGGRPFVCVKFSRVGRVHSFLTPLPPPEPALGPGEEVVVRVAGAPGYATVVRAALPVQEKRPPHPPSDAVLRRMTPDDLQARQKIQQRERGAYQLCLMKIRERGLAMKLTRVEQLPDGSRLIFYFTADGRVDFRELVRDLAAEFRTRIEMRQIGVRDEARLLGGYGSCGRPLCCTTWLQTFDPVSIKMAKQQKLSLNPTKLSGLCGRLKCCLRYELEGKVEDKGEARAGGVKAGARSGGHGGSAHEAAGGPGCGVDAAATAYGGPDGCCAGGCAGCRGGT
jgi:cell fate regulator YaaT (PSP1 superfamily)